MPPPNAYIVLGHGAEDIDAERKVVPDGCMLVVSEECGVLGTIPDYILEVAQRVEYEKWFRDPLTYKKELESVFRKPLHMYRPGDTYPTLYYTLFDKSITYGIYVSGIWPLPLPPSIVVTPDSINPYHIKGADAWKAYSGSVYPRIPKETTQDTIELLTQHKLFKTSQYDLFNKYPGVYFNFLCRDVRESLYARTFMENLAGTQVNPDMLNTIGAVGNWLTSPMASTTNAGTKNSIKGYTDTVRDRRSRSRNRTERRREEAYRAWYSLYNALESNIPYPTAYLLELLSAVPQHQINFQDPRMFFTLLHMAVDHEKYAIVDELLRRGANPNTNNHVGMGPLHSAAALHSPILTEKLLLAGADPTIKDLAHHSPLFYVRSTKSLELLVSRGANINETDNIGNTPLNEIIAHSKYKLESDFIKKMIELGADITIANKEGFTPFLTAIKREDIPSLNVLFDIFNTWLFDSNPDALTVAFNYKAEASALWLVSKEFPIPSLTQLARFARERGFKELLSAIVGDKPNRNRTNRTNGQQTRKKQRKSFK